MFMGWLTSSLGLDNGTQVGDAWKDNGNESLFAIVLSPDGKKVASGSDDGAVRVWDIDTGKVIKKWMGHTKTVRSICWNSDGERVVSGSEDGTIRVWDVESGKTILGPIEAVGNGSWVWMVCYSPDGTMIAAGGDDLKVWDANTGELLKKLDINHHGTSVVMCLAWTSDGKTLIAASQEIKKFDTATWTETAVLEGHKDHVYAISLSPNERILASVSWDKTARLWNLANNQLIGLPLNHKGDVNCAAFSADGKLLVTGCDDHHIYTWDVSAIVKEAGLNDFLSNNLPFLDADATQRRPPHIKDARQISPGFFDDFSTSRGQRDHHPTPPHRRTLLGRLPSFWRRRSNSPRSTERDTQSPSRSRSWARNIISGMQRRQDGSDIQLREPPVVEVPCTAAKPRNYHARRKKATSSSRLPNPHTTQHHSGVTQSNMTSLQQPPVTATPSTMLPAVTGTAVDTGTISRPHITIRDAGWPARFMLWVCCMPIQHGDDQH